VEDLYFARVIFFQKTDFFTSLDHFCETLPHDVVCSEIDYVLSYEHPTGLLSGVHTCPLKILGTKNPNFLQFADPKLTLSLTIL